MNSFQLNSLATSYYSGINSRALSAKLSPEEMYCFGRSMSSVNELNWLIYRHYTVADLKSRIIYERHKRQINIVFVDFLQRMQGIKHKNDRVREVEEIAMELANLSRDLNVAVFALCQLSGEAEKLPSDEIPSMKHFKESQAIGENLDCSIVLHNPKRLESPYDSQGKYTEPEFKVKVEQRYDFSGNIINLIGDLRTCNFREGNVL